MKKIISYIIITILTVPFITNAWEDYLFDTFESSPNAEQIKLIKDEKTRYLSIRIWINFIYGV